MTTYGKSIYYSFRRDGRYVFRPNLSVEQLKILEKARKSIADLQDAQGESDEVYISALVLRLDKPAGTWLTPEGAVVEPRTASVLVNTLGVTWFVTFNAPKGVNAPDGTVLTQTYLVWWKEIDKLRKSGVAIPTIDKDKGVTKIKKRNRKRKKVKNEYSI